MVLISSEYRDMIVIFGTTFFGIVLFQLNIFNMKAARKFSQIIASMTDVRKRKKPRDADTVSISGESQVNKSDPEDKQTDPKMELRIFKEFSEVYRHENAYLVFVFFLSTVVVVGASAVYLNVRYAVCFVIGYLDFFVALTLNRRLFTKLSWHTELSSSLVYCRTQNWNMFNFYISAVFFGLNFSLALFNIYLVSLFHHYCLNVADNSGSIGQMRVHRELKFTTDFISFATAFFFYLFGKSLVLVFGMVWDNYNYVLTNLSLSTGLRTHPSKTAFYSIAYTQNMLVRALKHNLIITEVVVFSTLFLAKYHGTDKNFFILFSAVLLWYLLGFSFVVTTCYNFSKLGAFLRMIAVMKLGFIYYFLTAFTFLFYRFFVKPGILIIDEANTHVRASFAFLYLFVAIVMIFIFAFNKSYAMKFPFKKLRKFGGESTKVFPYNLVIFSKITLTIVGLYFFYLFFGFLGIGLIVFIITLEDSFYKIDKLAFVFDTYLSIVLEFCHTCQVSFLDLNNLYNMVDKNYFYHLIISLFCIPLFRMDHLRYIAQEAGTSGEARLLSGFGFLGTVLLSFLLCRLLLMLYSRALLESYRQSLALGPSSLEVTPEKYHYADKYRFVIYAVLVFFIAMGIFIRFVSHQLLLCVILGSTLQCYLLVFLNKFRIKKLSGSAKQINAKTLHTLYKDIGNSFFYLKSLYETSFGETLIELNKLLLMVYFFLNFLKLN